MDVREDHSIPAVTGGPIHAYTEFGEASREKHINLQG